jgi:peptide/nickel transport system substrate-binding protein
MRVHRRSAAMIAAVAVAGLALAACSSSKSGDSNKSSGAPSGGKSSGGSSGGVSAAYNAGNSAIVNKSDATGGTVKYALSSTPDSFDPGNTYYAFVWDASRLWARPLTTFKPAPGKDGLTLVPDLAASLGTPSDGGKTWTYKLRPGLKYSDGTPIVSKDVKYGIERSNYARDVLSNGPTYFAANLVDNKTPYKGPYKDKTGGLDSIETPDDTTIVFHLKAPFADFDYLTSNPQTAPVPQAKDTGADYVKNIVSSGSYAFKSYNPNTGTVLVKNTNWSASTDPIRKQYADEIDIKFNQEQTGIDQDLIAGNLTGDIAGAGMAATSQADIVNDPNKKKYADDALAGFLRYVALNTKVKPLDNINCRIAVQYAVDKVAAQNAMGGPLRGDIASTVLPPNVLGYTKFDKYPTPNNSGDAAKAKEALTKCGHPNGFSVNMAVRGDRPNDVAGATSVQASLKKVGIKVSIQRYPAGKYFSDYAGAPAFVHSHNLGLMVMAWGADWPTGYGYLYSIVSGNAIVASGNSNLPELNDPQINSMLDNGIQNTDTAAREKVWGDVDKAVMDQAVIVPLIYLKDLLYRPPSATNVFVNPAYGMYDYLLIGTK